MDMIVETSIGPKAGYGCLMLNQIQLPCSKSMWEAETSSAWEEEHKKYLCIRKRSEVLTCGLLRLNNESDLHEVESDTVQDLSAWSKDLDTLGDLVFIGMQWQFY
jgi:hypothetical protein